MRKTLLTSWIIIFISGCGTVPFQEGKRIVREVKFLTKEYSQEGKKLRMDDMIFHLQQYDHAKGKINTGEAWLYSAAITGGSGSILVALNLLDFAPRNLQARDTQLIIGAGLVVLSMVSGYIANKYISDGVDLYNEHHTGKQNSTQNSGVGLQFAIKL